MGKFQAAAPHKIGIENRFHRQEEINGSVRFTLQPKSANEFG
jgi:hypothetical protein